MKIKIENRNTEVQLTFTPAGYFLVHSKDERFGDGEMVWTLNPRIDRSEKGKDDDIGMPVVYLEDKEAEIFKMAGFAWIEIDNAWNKHCDGSKQKKETTNPAIIAIPENTPIQNQVDLLAKFIVQNFEEEIGKGKNPNSEGAIEMAMRLLMKLKK